MRQTNACSNVDPEAASLVRGVVIWALIAEDWLKIRCHQGHNRESKSNIAVVSIFSPTM